MKCVCGFAKFKICDVGMLEYVRGRPLVLNCPKCNATLNLPKYLKIKWLISRFFSRY